MARWDTTVGDIQVHISNVGDDPSIDLRHPDARTYLMLPGDEKWPQMAVSLSWSQLVELYKRILASGMVQPGIFTMDGTEHSAEPDCWCCPKVCLQCKSAGTVHQQALYDGFLYQCHVCGSHSDYILELTCE